MLVIKSVVDETPTILHSFNSGLILKVYVIQNVHSDKEVGDMNTLENTQTKVAIEIHPGESVYQ